MVEVITASEESTSMSIAAKSTINNFSWKRKLVGSGSACHAWKPWKYKMNSKNLHILLPTIKSQHKNKTSIIIGRVTEPKYKAISKRMCRWVKTFSLFQLDLLDLHLVPCDRIWDKMQEIYRTRSSLQHLLQDIQPDHSKTQICRSHLIL